VGVEKSTSGSHREEVNDFLDILTGISNVRLLKSVVFGMMVVKVNMRKVPGRDWIDDIDDSRREKQHSLKW
jgi:hypothetical protein